MDGVDDLLLRIGQRTHLPAPQDLEIAEDGGERRRQLVREVLHELVLAAGRRAEPGVRRGQLADRRLQALDQGLAVLAQVPALLDTAELFTLASEEFAKLLGEPLHVDGLLDEPIRAYRERQAAVAVAGEDHDRAAVESLVRPQAGSRFVAVDSRKLDVAEDQVGMGADREVDAGDPVAGLEDVETARFEHAPHQRPAFRVVLYVENSRRRSKSCVGHR